jgi:hypothetical protein
MSIVAGPVLLKQACYNETRIFFYYAFSARHLAIIAAATCIPSQSHK